MQVPFDSVGVNKQNLRTIKILNFEVDEIEVLGEIQKNRHVSTSLETWNGQNTVNVTMIADGSGKFDVNGIPLHKFFSVSRSFDAIYFPETSFSNTEKYELCMKIFNFLNNINQTKRDLRIPSDSVGF